MEIPTTTQQSSNGEEIISSALAPLAVHLPTQASYNPAVITATVAALTKLSHQWVDKFPVVAANKMAPIAQPVGCTKPMKGAVPKSPQIRKGGTGRYVGSSARKSANRRDSDPSVRIQLGGAAQTLARRTGQWPVAQQVFHYKGRSRKLTTTSAWQRFARR